MTGLSSPTKELPRVGPAVAQALERVGVATVRDLLFYFPFRYLDFSKFSEIKDIRAGEVVTVRGFIKTIKARLSFRGRVSVCEAIVSDDSGSIKVIWFNQPYLAKQLHSGDEILLSGKAEVYKGLQLSNPVYEKAGDDTIHTGRIVPVYHLTSGLYHRTIRNLVKSVLPLASGLEENLTPDILKRWGLPSVSQAVAEIHFPTSEKALNAARQRIIFEEVFVQQLAVQQHNLLLESVPAPKIPSNVELIKTFLSTLPFELTKGQKQALWQIMKDMDARRPMNRLLEGDVGSGKTLVAMLAALEAADAGFQSIILAPTEILAKQHHDTFCKTFAAQIEKGLNVGLLTAKFHALNGSPTDKNRIADLAGSKNLNIIIGTHALLGSGLAYNNLGLVVIDEQHRFGVEQRALLLRKHNTAHLLSMSATPIPRTLALAFYGNLDISTLKELPSGRQPVATKVVAEDGRGQTYDFIKKELRRGRQAFVIAPRVEESENLQVKSAKQEFKRLSEEVFKDFKLGLLHGSMKAEEKEKIMDAFNAGSLDILVATSIVEIGVDVPNATVMLIEGAENFGLAQLHQLRGRVGRGQEKSYCFLFTATENPESQARLVEFAKTNDGFKLAEADLKQRGMGSLFGKEQTGFAFKFSQFLTLKVLGMAKEAAEETTKKDPELVRLPEIKKQVDPLVAQIHLE